MFWPGSEAAIQGIRPSYYRTYDHDLPHTDRVDQVIEWLALPADQRPQFIAMYFAVVDDYGHAYGPAAPEVYRAQFDWQFARPPARSLFSSLVAPLPI